MKNKEYERENLKITEFDSEDIITTSGEQPTQPPLSFNRDLYETRSVFDYNW